MKLYINKQELRYEAGNLCSMFFPGEKVESITDFTESGNNFILIAVKAHKSKAAAVVYINRFGKVSKARSFFNLEDLQIKKQCEFAVGRAFYTAASVICGFRPPWGILTGIRPVKLMRETIKNGKTKEQAKQLSIDDYYLSEEKASLCLETALLESEILKLSRAESFSLYISIPFCPSRCAYCSFVSHNIEKAAKLLPDYVSLLCRELEATAILAKELNLRLETIYIGGGTPTSLSPEYLKMIFDTVKRAFNFDTLREYTVEAGRPDTITKEKLELIRDAGANRISINPQTLDDNILMAVGRKHTADDIYKAYELAVNAKIKSINMDLIAGLPNDTPEGFAKTLEGVISLHPQAVTVHTLAMKRAADIVTSGEADYNAQGRDVSKMLLLSENMLHEEGYRPYYLYRQRNMVGNLENVGWSLPGYEGLYNVFIMDETHTILSVGAGGVTKMREPNGNRIERVFNLKYPYEYNAKFGEILDRKKQVKEFYDKCNRQNENKDIRN